MSWQTECIICGRETGVGAGMGKQMEGGEVRKA